MKERNIDAEFKKYKKIFLIGIGGAGMSAIATVLQGLKYTVCGSDLKESRYTAILENQGIKVFKGHNKENIRDADAIIYSAAIKDSNEELIGANSKKIPVYTRGEALSWILNRKKGIAVTGTHGKTTTTSMISLVFRGLGLDPTIIIGGELNELGSNARYGEGEYVIAEACESDGTFLKYRPYAGVITNIESDHIDYWKDFKQLEDSFHKFIGNIKGGGFAVLCGDDIANKFFDTISGTRLIKYGAGRENTVRAENIVFSNYSSRFDLVIDDPENKVFAKFEAGLVVPGIFNIKNSLAAFSVCYGIGLDIAGAVNILKFFTGARRRFEKRGEKKGAIIFDDYAHHPTEVKSTLEAAALEKKGRIIAVFQPHRYTRLQNLHNQFSQSFDDCDILIVTDVFSSDEAAIPGVTGKLLIDSLAEYGFRKKTVYIPSILDVKDYLNENLKKDDLVLMMGAGDITRVTEDLLKS